MLVSSVIEVALPFSVVTNKEFPMSRLIVWCAAVAVCMPLALGCSRKAEMQKETTVSTPEGETTKTETTTVESSGDNPPAADGTSVPPQP
jgi:hypothetical protein